MCLISICPSGSEKTTQQVVDFIEAGVKGNSHGSGVAIKRYNDNKIFFKKGLNTLKDILEYIDSMKPGKKDLMMIHHRIGTQGARNEFNTHPFVCSPKPTDICQVEGETLLPVMMHNGVFYGKFSGPSYSYFSDTWYFTKMFLSTPELLLLLQRSPNKFQEIFTHELGTNKISLLYPDSNNVHLLGNWVKDGSYIHSNNTYQYHKGYYNIGGQEYYDDIPVESSSKKSSNIGLGNFADKLIDKFSSKTKQTVATSKSGEESSKDSKAIKAFGKQNIVISTDNYKNFLFSPVINHSLGSSVVIGHTYEIDTFSSSKNALNPTSDWIFIKSQEKPNITIAVCSCKRLLDNATVSINKDKEDYAIWEDYLDMYQYFLPTPSNIKTLSADIKVGFNLKHTRVGFIYRDTIAVLQFCKERSYLFIAEDCYSIINNAKVHITLQRRVRAIEEKAKKAIKKDKKEVISDDVTNNILV